MMCAWAGLGRVVCVLGAIASLSVVQCVKEPPSSIQGQKPPADMRDGEARAGIVLTGGAEYRGGVDLVWRATEGLPSAEYEVSRRKSDEATFVVITRGLLPQGSNRYKDHEVTEGETCDYRVVAWVRGVPADSSNTVSVVVAYPLSPVYKLVRAYNARDVDLLADCLAEDFRYRCSRGSGGRSWDKMTEVRIHEKMFGSGTATDLLCGIDLSVSGMQLTKAELGEEAEEIGRIACQVDLLCSFEFSRGGWRSWRFQGPAEFTVRFNRGKGRWEIVEWEDKEGTSREEY